MNFRLVISCIALLLLSWYLVAISAGRQRNRFEIISATHTKSLGDFDSTIFIKIDKESGRTWAAKALGPNGPGAWMDMSNAETNWVPPDAANP